jgi:2-polyprenyl-3-methyl-5-hydroxy-6-metoxy-1,4-benzoquinol methylase
MNSRAPTTDFPPCNLCGAQSAEYLYAELDIIRCRQCGLVRANETPDRESIKRLYSESYFRSSDSGALGYDDYMADREKISRTFDRRIDEIERWIGHKGRLLDVGCATGFSLDVATQRGWATEGIEISEFACELGRRELGVDILCCSLDEVDFEPESFDVITMWDYIEHSPNPSGDVAVANRLLKTGGLLAVTTPDISSLPARISKSRWMGIKQEEHLFYFSRETVRGLFRKGGFEPVRLKHVGKYIDARFFSKRVGLYSPSLQGLMERVTGMLRISDKVFYVNPYDIMLVYGKKTGPVI